MPFPTITQMYEEYSHKRFLAVIGVAGHLLSPNPRGLHWDFSMGEVPTFSFEIDNPAPIWMIKDAAIQLWVGFNGTTAMCFNGEIESVDPSESGCKIQASGQSKKLEAPYKALLVTTDGVKDVSVLIADIFALGNIASYIIDLPAWVPGTVVQQPLKFSSLGEGINKLAEPYGSPYYEMPSGVIRVDVRDPIPAPTAFRTYWSGILTDGSYAQPASVAAVNPDALPTLRRSEKSLMSRDVRNKIIVRGAEIPGTGGAGEVITTLLEEIASGPSPWIPPVGGVDQFIEMIFSNEFIDTVPTMVAVALRMFNVWNRLYEKVSITVDGDPEIFLGATVEVIDPGYSGINAKYVVMGYSCDVSDSGFTTTLDLQGGRSAGVTAALSPFAFFVWTNMDVPIAPTIDPNSGNPTNTAPGASKVRQFVPKADPEDPEDPGQDPTPPTPPDPPDFGQRVIVTFDASASVDPDGRIVSYEWLDDASTPHSGTGKRFTVLFNPDDDNSVNMTLTVTDNSGLTASVTQNVNVNTFAPEDGYGSEDDDGTTEDDSSSGGTINVPVIFVTTEDEGTAATSPGDGGSTFNTYPDFGHTMRCVVAEKFKDTPDMIAIYAGKVVYITTSYLQVPPTTVELGDYGIANDIVGSGGSFTICTSEGSVLKSEDYGQTWREQANVDDVLYRLSGQFVLGGRGVYFLTEDGELEPLDPDQVSVSPYITEPAFLLVDEEDDITSILFNNHFIPNICDVVFDGSGQSTGTGVFHVDDFVKVIRGEENYIALAAGGDIYEGTGESFSQAESEPSTGLSDATDFVQEGGMDGVFLATYSGGVAKTLDNGIHWRQLALRASGMLTISGEVGDEIMPGDTMTIGTKVYTFVEDEDPDALPTPLPGPVADGEIGVTGDIVAAINGDDGINSPHPQVIAEDGIKITAIVPGTPGDSIATTETFTSANNVFDSATLGAKVVRAGLVVEDNPANGDTFTVESKTFTFVLSASSEGEVELGTLEETQENITKAINGTDGHNTAHSLVLADDFAGNTGVVQTKTVRDTGYTLATSETFSSPNNEWIAGTTGVDVLSNGLRLQAVNVPQTAPIADLYAITDTEEDPPPEELP